VLLHRLVDSNLVVLLQLVKLVDANKLTVRKNHRFILPKELSSRLTNHRLCKSCRHRPFPEA
jgi:hypothetical protein